LIEGRPAKEGAHSQAKPPRKGGIEILSVIYTLDRSSSTPKGTPMRFCSTVAMLADLITIIVGLIVIAEKLS
jgi:hypothetical protein